MSFQACASLLLFCLDDLSTYVRGVLKFLTIIVWLPISPFGSVSICLIYQGAPMLGAHTFTVVISSSWINPLIFMESPLFLVCARVTSVVSDSLCFSRAWLFVPLSKGFSRKEHWSGLLCSPPRNLPDPGTESASLMPPALAGRVFTTSTTWEALISCNSLYFKVCFAW